MKQYKLNFYPAFMLLAVFLGSAAKAQTKGSPDNLNHRYYTAKGSPKLLGKVNRNGLQQEPFNQWFSKGYNEYEADLALIERLKPEMDQIEVKIFMGTWCGDSKREVPRFCKILDKTMFDEAKLEIICLDYEAGDYKQSPGHEEVGMDIHRVPTFIILKNHQEIGRIIESPKTSLEADLALIVNGGNYQPRYPVVAQLMDQFKSNNRERFMVTKQQLDNYRSQIENEWALDSFGRVLFYATKTEEAIYVLRIQNELFPDNLRSYTNLARAYYSVGKDKEGKKLLSQALSMDPEDETANSLKAAYQQ